LFILLENITRNDNETHQLLFQGFYYYSQKNKEICFYHIKTNDKTNKIHTNNDNLITKYGIIVYHLCYYK
jgi:hypothetical protein